MVSRVVVILVQGNVGIFPDALIDEFGGNFFFGRNACHLKVTVQLNIKKDCYEAEFSNLGLTAIPIEDEYPEKYDRLLCGGI